MPPIARFAIFSEVDECRDRGKFFVREMDRRYYDVAALYFACHFPHCAKRCAASPRAAKCIRANVNATQGRAVSCSRVCKHSLAHIEWLARERRLWILALGEQATGQNKFAQGITKVCCGRFFRFTLRVDPGNFLNPGNVTALCLVINCCVHDLFIANHHSMTTT